MIPLFHKQIMAFAVDFSTLGFHFFAAISLGFFAENKQ
jgi:hypothetical protein